MYYPSMEGYVTRMGEGKDQLPAEGILFHTKLPQAITAAHLNWYYVFMRVSVHLSYLCIQHYSS
jgi:hypothetical protein